MVSYRYLKITVGLAALLATLFCFANTYKWERLKLVPEPEFISHGKPTQAVMVNGISGVKSDPNYIMVAATGAVFASTDGGGYLKDCSESLRDNYNMSVDVVSKNIAFVGQDPGLYATYDGGKDWKRINLGDQYGPAGVTGIANAGDTVYVASKDGLYISKDLGRHWIKPKCHWNFCGAYWFHFYIKSPGDIYLSSTRDGIFHSSDQGLTWTSFEPGALTSYIFTKKYLFLAKAIDGFFSKNLLTKKYNVLFDAPGKDFQPSALAKTNNHILYVGDNEADIYQSIDGGKTWHEIAKHLTKDGTVNVIYAPTKNVVYAGIQPHGLWKGTLVTQHKK